MKRQSRFRRAAVPGLAILLVGGVVSTQEAKNQNAAALKNPVAATPESIAAGKKAYDANCAGCHGDKAQGAEKAGIVDLDHPGAGRQTAARSDRRHVGSRVDRRRDLHRHQEGRAADDDGRVGWPDLGHRDLEHRQLPSRARGERECHGGRAGARAGGTGHAAADAGAGRLRPDADHRRPRRREHARPAGAREFPARRAGRPALLRERPQRPALHPRQDRRRQFTTYLDFNGLAGRPGLFQKFTFERNFATGLINVLFDPDYARNGVFYTIHMEDPTTAAPAEPKAGVVPGLDLSGYRTTPAIVTPTTPGVRDHARGRDDRMDRPQHRQRDVRRHGARAAAAAAHVADPSAR